MSSNKPIAQLLEEVAATFPEFVREVKNRLPEDVSTNDMRMEVFPPASVSFLPTFEPEYQRTPSSMLEARFEYASDIYRGYMHWLGIESMHNHLQSDALLQNHRGLREHWEGSAPMQFDDRCLGVFAVDPNLSTDVIYLVWQNGDEQEPELWLYCGMEEKRFSDLSEFLAWCLSA